MGLINDVRYIELYKYFNSAKNHPLVEETADRTRSTSHDTSTSSATTTEGEAEFNDDLEESEIARLPSEETSETMPGVNPLPKAQFTPSKSNNTLYEIKNPVPGTVQPVAVSNNDCQEILPSDDITTTNNKHGEQEPGYKLEFEFPFLHAVAKTVGGWYVFLLLLHAFIIWHVLLCYWTI